MPVDERPEGLDRHVGSEQEELDRHELLRALLGVVGKVRHPVKRHTITTLANPSIAESSPNPIRATDPAAIPARWRRPLDRHVAEAGPREQLRLPCETRYSGEPTTAGPLGATWCRSSELTPWPRSR